MSFSVLRHLWGRQVLTRARLVWITVLALILVVGSIPQSARAESAKSILWEGLEVQVTGSAVVGTGAAELRLVYRCEGENEYRIEVRLEQDSPLVSTKGSPEDETCDGKRHSLLLPFVALRLEEFKPVFRAGAATYRLSLGTCDEEGACTGTELSGTVDLKPASHLRGDALDYGIPDYGFSAELHDGRVENGSPQISITYTCEAGSDVLGFVADLQQEGRDGTLVQAEVFVGAVCDGSPQTAPMSGTSVGSFEPGRVAAIAWAIDKSQGNVIALVSIDVVRLRGKSL